MKSKFFWNYVLLAFLIVGLSYSFNTKEAQQITVTPQVQGPIVFGKGQVGTEIKSLPFVINDCGRYFVTKCLRGAVGANGITVNASDVTIDLNGFALKGVPGSLNGIEANSGFENVTVQNGTLRDWDGDGFRFGGVEVVVADNIRAIRNKGDGFNGNGTETTLIVKDCIASRNDKSGFRLMQSGVVVRSVSRNNGGAGFSGNDVSFIGNMAGNNNTIDINISPGTRDHNFPAP